MKVVDELWKLLGTMYNEDGSICQDILSSVSFANAYQLWYNPVKSMYAVLIFFFSKVKYIIFLAMIELIWRKKSDKYYKFSNHYRKVMATTFSPQIPPITYREGEGKRFVQ